MNQYAEMKLGLLRAWVFTVAVGYALMIPLTKFSVFPLDVQPPLGLARLLPSAVWIGLHQPSALAGVQVALLIALVASALGVRGYRFIAPLAAALLLLHQTLVRVDSSGHRELALLYCVCAFALVPAGNAFTLAGRRSRAALPPESYEAAHKFIAFTFLFTYAATGVYRWSHAAPGIFLDNSIGVYTLSNDGALRNGIFQFTFGSSVLETWPHAQALLKVGFCLATLAEAFALFCLVNATFRRCWVAFCVLFHVANFLLFNIEFTLNVLLTPVVLSLASKPGPLWLAVQRLSANPRFAH